MRKTEYDRDDYPLSETVQVSFKVNRELVRNIRKIARERAESEGYDITYLDLIREALDAKYGEKR